MTVEAARILIDQWLSETKDRDLFSTSEVVDHLLDLRALLDEQPVPA